MSEVKQGSWVQIERKLLDVGDRAPQVPEETKKVPLKLWVKGYLQEDAEFGEIVKIKTSIGRILEGKLVAHNPRYEHNFGRLIPELLSVGEEFRELIQGDDQ